MSLIYIYIFTKNFNSKLYPKHILLHPIPYHPILSLFMITNFHTSILNILNSIVSNSHQILNITNITNVNLKQTLTI